MDSKRKEQIKTAVAAAIVVLLILTAVVVVYRYSVEGEENMPFKLSKILVVSSIVSEDNNNPESTEGTLVQNNGVYLEIQKSEKYNKDAIIKTAEIANIQITKMPLVGDVNLYFPSSPITNEKAFTYSDDYILEGNSLKYNGSNKNDASTLEINNQGGMIAIAFGNNQIGGYTLSEEKEVTLDGTLLKEMELTNNDINFTVNFDLIITTGGKKYKTNITLELPPKDITESGKSQLEITDTSKYIFKRLTN